MTTTNELIDQVRDQIDEANTSDVTDAQIIQSLNRGQRNAANIIARQYDQLFWATANTAVTAGTRTYDIPVAAAGRRVEKVEWLGADGVHWEIRKISTHKRTPYMTSATASRPFYYSQRKNTLELYPTPSASGTLVVHYQDRPEPLVTSQGRLTTTGDGSTYVVVDTLGSSLTTTATTVDAGAYVNIIDYNTGDIKCTMQISAINTSTKAITFKSSGLTRSTVLGRTVSTSLATDVAQDDYICLVTGTCVPELDGMYTDYLIQYAVVELRRRQGEDTTAEYAALKDLETQLEHMWVGRESSLRVRKTGSTWRNDRYTATRRFS